MNEKQHFIRKVYNILSSSSSSSSSSRYRISSSSDEESSQVVDWKDVVGGTVGMDTGIGMFSLLLSLVKCLENIAITLLIISNLKCCYQHNHNHYSMCIVISYLVIVQKVIVSYTSLKNVSSSKLKKGSNSYIMDLFEKNYNMHILISYKDSMPNMSKFHTNIKD